jgi:O-antigen ligase
MGSGSAEQVYRHDHFADELKGAPSQEAYMGSDVAVPLHLKREAAQLKRRAAMAVPRARSAKPRQRVSVNALLGMGLWILLWFGYNTDPEAFFDPHFPVNALQLIHGVRAFFPILGAWIALLMIFSRSKCLVPWLVGPLGLMLLYAVTGLISSVTYSPDPTTALYYGANYLAIVLVLLAIVLVDDPLRDLRKVLNLTWTVGTVLTLSLLGAIPFLGSAAVSESEFNPVKVTAYSRVMPIMGMVGSRNTGFARYAAISALVALSALLRKGKPAGRIVWAILFTTSLYALIIANGRTETVAFAAGVVVMFGIEKAHRFRNFLLAIVAAIVMGFREFYSAFYLYITRTGHMDMTMTGRTRAWEEGWSLLGQSPWVGFGFQADRFFMLGHTHNAFLHALIQSGFLGGGAILLGLGIVWYLLIKYFFFRQPTDKSLIPPEIPAVFLFVTISSFLESTFAYYSATWLLSAPIVAYVMALHWHMQRVAWKSQQDRLRLGIQPKKRKARITLPSLEETPSTPGVDIPSNPR